jgi:hypothetical protein
MTRQQFMQVLIRLNPNNGKSTNDLPLGVWLPMVAMGTASHCFVKQVPENDDTRTLRYQINHLANKGHWDFEDV